MKHTLRPNTYNYNRRWYLKKEGIIVDDYEGLADDPFLNYMEDPDDNDDAIIYLKFIVLDMPLYHTSAGVY